MAKGVIHSADLKAKVMADYASGMSQMAIVRKYDLPRTTIRQWTAGLGSPMVASEIKEELDAQVLQLTISGLKTLRAILRHARNTEWLEKQSANDLAIFFGVTTDKITNVLAAYERGQQIIEENEQARLASGISEDSE